MIKKLYLSATFLLGVGAIAVAQIGSMKNIGRASDWIQSINSASTTSAKSDRTTTFSIPTSTGSMFPVIINIKHTENGTVTIAGGDQQKGNFSLSADGNGKVKGYYHSLKDRKAYSYTTNTTGDLIATEVAIETMLCMDYTRALEIPSDEAAIAKRPARTTAIPKYSSRPDSKYVIYIDLDGESTSSSWGNIYAQPLQSWTDAEVFAIWQVAAQDFLVWDINVTTDRSMYDAQSMSRKMMCIVTSTLDAADGQAIGGIAHIGSFGGSSFNPCWVFNKGVKKTGETVCHEVGHTLGLNHDGTSNSTYYQGHNNWGPIMGAAYSTKTVMIDDANRLSHWSKGEYSGADNGENDLGIIGGYNGFDITEDEHANTATSAATDLVIETDGKVLSEKNIGIIQTRTDLDVFKFTIPAGDLNLTAAPYYSEQLNRYPNLNIKMRLLNSEGGAIVTEDSLPPTVANTWAAMSANITVNGIAEGTYYLEIDGVGQGSSGAVGYTDYCSIGGFNISGLITKSVGIAERGKISQFNIYPNPNAGNFFVTFNTEIQSTYKLSVVNTLGQIVYEETLAGFSGAYSKQLNLEQYGKGVFMMNIADESSSSTKRVVVY